LLSAVIEMLQAAETQLADVKRESTSPKKARAHAAIQRVKKKRWRAIWKSTVAVHKEFRSGILQGGMGDYKNTA